MSIKRLGTLAMSTGLAAGLAVMLTPSPAGAAQSCRDRTHSISGAYVEFTMCWDGLGTGADYYLQDTARDSRRAEIWVKTPRNGTQGEEVDEATGGQWDSVVGDFYTLDSSGVYIKVCTSDANTNRVCSAWL
ncbi:hypothetical protein [Streptomyces pristinaespiralis]|jgi:hypothetical protein|uniref:hypothetical protein n=1 Tax=Streptomyces pristinaespiralis TaxID=38300 RepID=UPI0038355F54